MITNVRTTKRRRDEGGWGGGEYGGGGEVSMGAVGRRVDDKAEARRGRAGWRWSEWRRRGRRGRFLHRQVGLVLAGEQSVQTFHTSTPGCKAPSLSVPVEVHNADHLHPPGDGVDNLGTM